MKKTLYIILWILFTFTQVLGSGLTIVCNWLPWCEEDSALWTKTSISGDSFFTFFWKIISEWIKYVAVISIFSLMFAWVLYITSAWKDEKFDQAKRWITYSIIWVIISISWWTFVNLLNMFKITTP